MLEASSHALHQHRLDGVSFDYAVFSNLTRDHLDYHSDYQRYGDAKGRLKRIMIVALARKLVVALWRYLETGVVPTGAVLKA